MSSRGSWTSSVQLETLKAPEGINGWALMWGEGHRFLTSAAADNLDLERGGGVVIIHKTGLYSTHPCMRRFFFLFLVWQAAILLLSDRKQLIKYAYQLKHLRNVVHFIPTAEWLTSRKMLLLRAVSAGVYMKMQSVKHSTQSEYLTLRAPYMNVLVVAAAAALIKQCLSPHTHSHTHALTLLFGKSLCVSCLFLQRCNLTSDGLLQQWQRRGKAWKSSPVIAPE